MANESKIDAPAAAAGPTARPAAGSNGLWTRFLRLPWKMALHNWIRGFYLGFGFEVGPGLLRILITALVIAVQRVLGRGGAAATGKQSSIARLLHRELDSVLRREAVPFAVFVGAFASSYPILREVAGGLLGPKRQHWVPTVAGAVAASAILLDNSTGARDRRVIFALYMMVRAGESVATSLVKHGQVPYFAHMDTVLFQLSCLEIMYSWFFTPETLPREYVSWISRLADMDHRLLNYLRAFRRGEVTYGRENTILVKYCVDHHLPAHMGNALYGFIDCQVVHPHAPHSCAGNAQVRWINGFKQALLIYLPVHILPSLLFRPNALTSAPIGFVIHNVLSASRSASFLATFIASIWYCECLVRNVLKTETIYGPMLGSAMCGLSLLIERKSRRMELALYCVPRALYSLYLKHSQAGRLPHIPHFDLAMFCVSAGVLMNYAEREPGSVRHSIFSFVRWLFALESVHPGSAKRSGGKAATDDDDDERSTSLVLSAPTPPPADIAA